MGDNHKEPPRDAPAPSRRRGAPDERSGPAKRSRGPGPYAFKALLSDEAVGFLIGRGGANLKDIQERTRTKLTFSERSAYFPETRCRVVTVRADEARSLEDALDVVADNVQAAANKGDEDSIGRSSGDCRIRALLARYHVGALLGRGGEEMQRIRDEISCWIEVEKAPIIEGHQRVDIHGEVEEVKRALRRVNEKVQGEVDRDWYPAWAAQNPLELPSKSTGASDRDRERDRGRNAGERGDKGSSSSSHGYGGSGAGARSSGVSELDAPSEADMADFRDRFPMDKRAYDFLMAASGEVKSKVLHDFNPKPSGDYSALITSFTAKVSKRLDGGHRTEPRTERTDEHEGDDPPPVDLDVTKANLKGDLEEMPKSYLEQRYRLDCVFPPDSCGPLEQNLREVSLRTGVTLELSQPEEDGMRRLSLTGPLTGIYAAHLKLMWFYNDGVEEEARKQREAEASHADPDQLKKMQDQIKELEAQLKAVKQQGRGSGGGGGGAKSKGKGKRNSK